MSYYFPHLWVIILVEVKLINQHKHNTFNYPIHRHALENPLREIDRTHLPNSLLTPCIANEPLD